MPEQPGARSPAGQAPVPPEDAPTAEVTPRWTGSAPVPGGGRRNKRDRTLELTAAERESLDAAPPAPIDAPTDAPPPPVDPWADAPPPTWELPPPPPPPPPPPQRQRSRRLPAVPPPRQRRPAPPPPGWVPVPPGYELRKRRRRWPWTLTVLLLTFGCCCACPAYYLKPYFDQYPATVSLPAEVAGLALRDDASSARVVQDLKDELRGEHLLAEDVFAGVYAGKRGQRVTVFGATGLRLSPQGDLSAEVARLTPAYGLTGVADVDAGHPGGYASCGVGRAGGAEVVLCAWADHGSLGVATFSEGSLADGEELLRTLHARILDRG